MSNFLMPMQATERVAQLGQSIRVARIRRGWSVADLASKAGINRNTLTALELGKPGTAVGVSFSSGITIFTQQQPFTATTSIAPTASTAVITILYA